MANLKPHPRLAMRYERFGRTTSAISLSGFVGPSAAGLVRLFPTPDAREYAEIPEAAVLHSEQDEKSGLTQLFLDPSAIVTVVSEQKVPLVALALRQQGGGPDAGTGKTCLERRIEKCKNDPTVANKAFCESDAGKQVFQLLCDLFGDPKVAGWGGGVIL